MKEVIVEKEHRYRGKLRKVGERYEAEKQHIQLGKALKWFREAPAVPAPAPIYKPAPVVTRTAAAVPAKNVARKTAAVKYGTRDVASTPSAPAETVTKASDAE